MGCQGKTVPGCDQKRHRDDPRQTVCEGVDQAVRQIMPTNLTSMPPRMCTPECYLSSLLGLWLGDTGCSPQKQEKLEVRARQHV